MKIPMRVPYRYEGVCPLCGTRILVLTPEPVTDDMRACSRCRESGAAAQALRYLEIPTPDEAA